MTSGLKHKAALVTGGSRGIGRAIAERLARDGAAVIVNYVAHEQAAREVVDGISKAGGKAHAVRADVSKVAEIARLFDEAEATFGTLDIVVANAGTAKIGPFVDFTEQDFDEVFNTNAKGVFFVMQQAAKRVRDGGRIIVVSTGGVKMFIPGNALYLASKGPLQQLVRTVAQELGPRNITVNALLPGYTDTDLMPERDRKVAAGASPFNRVGQPADVADAAAFLASDDARWVTAQELGAGGGVF
jgi:3-oxoacyl-[acyl-carrier protein] reductase